MPRTVANDDVLQMLNEALERELGSHLTLLHHSFLVTGLQRAVLRDFLRERAQECIDHAILLGDKISARGGHPSAHPQLSHPSGEQTLEEMLRENLQRERTTLELYVDSLALLSGDVALDHLFRSIIVDKQSYVDEFEKLLPPTG
ncbi:MAG: ferritin-like domain-containing protein [Myxococcota bacterium]